MEFGCEVLPLIISVYFRIHVLFQYDHKEDAFFSVFIVTYMYITRFNLMQARNIVVCVQLKDSDDKNAKPLPVSMRCIIR